VAKRPGSDPVLKNEFIVLSAHMDHLGIGAPINGDHIYNGAMDDGSGSALVLDEAASLFKSIVADVNVDMFLPIVPLKILKVEGIEESDLGSRAAAIAQSMASSRSLTQSR
jgi:hypothetical protein